jgi:hypothetical protein
MNESKAIKQLKGKDLRVGMHVIVEKASAKSALTPNTGIPLTVRAIELPFVVFESEQSEYSFSMTMFGRGSERKVQKSFTVNTKKCRFREVSDNYVNSIRSSKVEANEFPDII